MEPVLVATFYMATGTLIGALFVCGCVAQALGSIAISRILYTVVITLIAFGTIIGPKLIGGM
jgi:hypothetical protein